MRNIEEMKREILITGHVKGTHVFGFVYQERVARGHVDICLVVVTASSTLVDTHTYFLKCPPMKPRYSKNGDESCPIRPRYRYSFDTSRYSYRKSID
ncbi:hypothetical protein QL285_027362 [Trifolium repens]|nr:hypothetical protein QL285_027362 [Trifolium repens]